MKISAISDIHSNVYALDAVLSDINKQGVDLCVNLGDILYGPIAPQATYELLMQHELITIKGNQDRQIYQALQTDIDSNSTLAFILQDLGAEALQWMQSLPASLQLNEQVFLCHGTPTNDLIYLLENIESGHALLRSDTDIIKLLDGETSQVILCGHSHQPRTVLTSSQQLIINPGSVGLPAYNDDEPRPHSIENFSPHASYCILEKSKGAWHVQNRKIAYQHHKAASDALRRNRNDWAHYLTTGRSLSGL
ncbi:metallophosphoesterase [Agaribacterium sp. ZY112]|uniref:metallophosphoesterase family protein n=1 Tax=Agaribacterium sp. ZY112 TaxID=3233574 RepID=UPI003526496F